MHSAEYKFSEVISSIEKTSFKHALHQKYPYLTILQQMAQKNANQQEAFDQNNFISLDKINNLISSEFTPKNDT